MNKLKAHFYNSYGLSGYSVVYIFIIGMWMLLTGVNSYTGWKCNNYEQVAGFEVKYVEWDACYIKGSDGRFVRYDSYYKDIK